MSGGKRSRQGGVRNGGTASTRKHRFESFNQRISKLSIDPVRRVRQQNGGEDDSEPAKSYFGDGLAVWKTSNLSETFTRFVREAEPLCDSLPQVLHYRSRLVELLHQYLERRETIALEPLLALQADLARDLGARFEQFFPSTLKLVLSIASQLQSVEVIEWSFSCLAWLFKYLSRLLVPDLRPTYDIVATALGKENHKPFIALFAAESLAFLMRKAATVYQKNQEYLDIIVDHVFLDVSKFQNAGGRGEVYAYGVMSLFAESIKGVGRAFHSCGLNIFKAMLKYAGTSIASEILYGVTTNLLHHADETTFAPILECIRVAVESDESSDDTTRLQMYSHLLFLISTVRKGTRVLSWLPVLSALEQLFERLSRLQHPECFETYLSLDKVTAVALQAAPLDSVLQHIQLFEKAQQQRCPTSYLGFCINYSEMHRERFEQFAHRQLSRIFAMHWSELEVKLLCTAYVIQDAELQTPTSKSQLIYPCPKDWEHRIVMTFEAPSYESEALPRMQTYLDIMDSLALSQTARDRVFDCLQLQISKSINSELLLTDQTRFLFGGGLTSLLRWRSKAIQLEWQAIGTLTATFGSMPLFVETLSELMNVAGNDPSEDYANAVMHILIRNLSSSSKTLRKASLKSIIDMCRNVRQIEPDVLIAALAIEDIPLDVQSARTASMHVRRISEGYRKWANDPWIARAIPYFCFGLLHFKLSQLWSDSVETLKVVVNSQVGDEAVTELVFTWLDISPTREREKRTSVEDVPRSRTNEFQCSHSAQVDQIMSAKYDSVINADKRLRARFDTLHAITKTSASSCRAQALTVLKGIPELAEGRSRWLVPFLFRAASDQRLTEGDAGQEDETTVDSSEADKFDASIPKSELKVLLDIFGSFLNPSVLYRASDVYDTLLKFLAVGDVQIQRSALKAILTWRSKALEAHREGLSNLLDDARFREEVAVFVRPDKIQDLQMDEVEDDLMPVLLRVLFGRIISRQGTSGSNSLSSKRRAVFDALGAFPDEAVREFISIALSPLQHLQIMDEQVANDEPSSLKLQSQKQKTGLLNLVHDLLDMMGSRVTFCLPRLLEAVFVCSRQSADNAGKPLISQQSTFATTYKTIRRTAVKCLLLTFRRFDTRVFQTYVPLILQIFISPRLATLGQESGQSVSGLFEIFSAWAASPHMVFYLVDYDSRLMPSIISILESPSVKDEVKLFVLNQIFQPMASLAKAEQPINLPAARNFQGDVLRPYTVQILAAISALLKSDPSKQILEASLEFISSLAQFVEGAEQIRGMVELCSFLLRQPARQVNPKSKGDILEALLHFIPLMELSATDGLFDDLFEGLTSLFEYFKDQGNRTRLAQTFSALADIDPELSNVARICRDLNSFSTTRIDMPDFDRRFEAFQTLDVVAKDFTARQWAPVIHNMLFYIQDTEELTIRTSASHCLKQFVKSSSSKDDLSPEQKRLRKQLSQALRNGVSKSSELVRAEYLTVFAEMLRCNQDWEEISDLRPLLVQDDEEASFFTNILHIQQHRRLRAMRRLATEATNGVLRSWNIAHFLVPLLEHFIPDTAEDSSAHNLTAEAITTLGALTKSLEWPQLRAMFRRYMNHLHNRPELERPTMRLLKVFADAMVNASSNKLNMEQNCIQNSASGEDKRSLKLRSTLSQTMPQQEKLSLDIRSNFLSPLQDYVHHKDETMVSQRMPVAVVIVKLLQLLQPELVDQCLPNVLTDVCQVLRSRAQESRDLTRKTLAEISQVIGPKYFKHILKELRTALPRGYQLHVLSYTVHSILSANAGLFLLGDLDYCTSDIIEVLMDDIFGTTGQEKDAEDYVSKMKEVKSNKSYDSVEILAQITSMTSVKNLISPLYSLLDERLDLRTLKKVDEVLRRIGVGLLHNSAVGSQAGLILCYELLQQVYGKTAAAEPNTQVDKRLKRFLISFKRSNKDDNPRHAISYRFKLARFSLDLLRTILTKFDSLKTASNLSGLMAAISEALISSHEEVQVSSMRLLAAIIRTPLQEIDSNAPVYLAEAVKTIKNAPSTGTETAQAALKLVTGILRERPSVEIRDADLSYLLRKVKSDLEEPDRQGVIFNFFKAVLQKIVLIPEVYEIMDSVSAIMVTNQSSGARDMARGLYIQFFINYPQSKDRLKKQLAFLTTNLSYEHVEGRQSVMEAIHQLLNRTGESIIQSIVGSFFVPLVIVIANDDSEDCRRMSSTLIKAILERADDEGLSNMLSLLRGWLNQDEQVTLIKISLQAWPLYLETHSLKAEKELSLLQDRLHDLLQTQHAGGPSEEWEILYLALQVFAKLLQVYPKLMLQPEYAPLWDRVQGAAAYPHAWVKLASSTLLGKYFADFARANAGQATLMPPLQGSGGLEMDLDSMTRITQASIRGLKAPEVGEELANQLTKNLGFLARLFGSLEDDAIQVQPRDTMNDEVMSHGEDDAEDDSDQVHEQTLNQNPLQYIFDQVSVILRRELKAAKAPMLVPKVAAGQLLASLCSHLPPQNLTRYLSTILYSLHNLIDPNIMAPSSFDQEFKAKYQSLVSNAHGIIELLQKRLGTSEVVSVMAEIKKVVDKKRDERRVKRKIEAVTDPERVGLKREKKHTKAKLRRKEKNAEQRSRRRGW